MSECEADELSDRLPRPRTSLFWDDSALLQLYNVPSYIANTINTTDQISRNCHRDDCKPLLSICSKINHL